MNRFVLAVIALVVLLIAIVVVAPGLVPVGAFKPRIEAAASQTLGRKVTIGDGLRFQLVPQTAFHVSNLEIANADGFEAPYLARVKSADIGVKLWPLLSRKVELEKFALEEPDIRLERAADGRVNWNLAEAAAAPSSAAPAETEGSADMANALGDLRLGDVRISGGSASYKDAASGQSYSASDIDMTARLERLAEPLEIEGKMTFEGAPTSVDIVLTSLADILQKKDSNLKLDLTLGDTKAGADLVLKAGDALSYQGPVTFDAPDLPAFAALLGAPLADAPGFDKLSVEGVAAGTPDGVSLTDAKINFDAIDADGDLALNWAGARPKATGRLAAGALDLRPYLPPPSTEAPQGFPAWSEEKLDFSGLKNIDADIDLSAEKIFLNDMEFGESRLKLVIDNGRLTADIPELGAYDGDGSGRLVVDARQAVPTISGKFDMSAVKAEPFVKDAMKIDRLLGLGSFKVDFTAKGSSQKAIMNSLDGSGGFEVADGALKGVNLAKIARAIADLQKGGFNPSSISSAVATAQGANEETDFSDFLSQFTMKNGLVSTSRISLIGPFLTMNGTGSVNLPGQTIDLKLAPRISSTADFTGGEQATVPMRVTGTFSQPKITVDVESIVRGRAETAVKGILQDLGKNKDSEDQSGDSKESAAKAVLDSFLRDGPKSDEQNPDSGDASASGGAASALKQILGDATKQPDASKDQSQGKEDQEKEPQ